MLCVSCNIGFPKPKRYQYTCKQKHSNSVNFVFKETNKNVKDFLNLHILKTFIYWHLHELFQLKCADAKWHIKRMT